jgi:hypothetical protein
MDRNIPPPPNEASGIPHDREQDKDERDRERGTPDRKVDRSQDEKEPSDDLDSMHGGNPPRTTTGPITAPKFGSAGSGGAEIEPGPERD